MALVRKTITAHSTLVLASVLMLLAAVHSRAQSGEKFNARLAPAPALGLRGGGSAVAGIGSATATRS